MHLIRYTGHFCYYTYSSPRNGWRHRPPCFHISLCGIINLFRKIFFYGGIETGHICTDNVDSMPNGFLLSMRTHARIAVVLHQRTIDAAALTVSADTKVFLMFSLFMFACKFTDCVCSHNAFTCNRCFRFTYIKRTKCQCVYRFICHIFVPFLCFLQLFKICIRCRRFL